MRGRGRFGIRNETGSLFFFKTSFKIKKEQLSGAKTHMDVRRTFRGLSKTFQKVLVFFHPILLAASFEGGLNQDNNCFL